MTAAVIVAAGSGTRMGGDLPKQFLKLTDGEMILTKTIRAFQECEAIDQIVLVTGEDWISFCQEEIVDREGFRKVTDIVPGGAARYDSVYAGLLACPRADYVLIHDGARPFVSEEVILRTISAAREFGACVAGVPTKDTVKITDSDGYIKDTPRRDRVWNIQTPQAFRYTLIRMAYELVRETPMDHITDDAMVVEASGLSRVKIVMGDYANIKITTPDDLGR